MCAVMRLLLALAATFAWGGAAAQSLKSLRAQQSEEQALAKEGAYTARICGGEIATEIDWNTVHNWPESQSLAAACGGALSALESLCRAGSAPHVDRFLCTGDGAGPGYRDGALSFGASPGGNAYAETLLFLNGL